MISTAEKCKNFSAVFLYIMLKFGVKIVDFNVYYKYNVLNISKNRRVI